MWKDFCEISHNLLLRDGELLQYLTDRNISVESIKKFQLGKMLSQDVMQQNFNDDWLDEKGLVYKPKPEKNLPNYYNAFQNYDIVFPIIDVHNNYIGIAARTIKKNFEPKYYNTKYKKSYNLYGLNLSKDNIRSKNNALVVEGYFDVISAHQNGLDNTVGVCNASLTEGQVLLLTRYTGNVYRILDNDKAGLKSHKKWNNRIQYGLMMQSFTFKGHNIKDLDEYFSSGGSPNNLFKRDLINVNDTPLPIPTQTTLQPIIK